MLVLTLIANPQSRLLQETLANQISAELGASPPIWLGEACACDIDIPEPISMADAQKLAQEAVAESPIDVVIQEKTGRQKRALIADMDSTMIEQECIDELADEVGLKEKISAITARAMNGELDFAASVEERVAILDGVDAGVSETILANRITLTPGARTMVQTMKAKGAYTALVSGGFTSFTGPIAEKIGFDENRANILEEKGGKLIGKVRKPILGASSKVDALHEIAERLNLSPVDFIAVGDGANDIPMLQLAGTGVALHAKPSVAEQTRININHGDLTSLLYIQGIAESEFIDG